MSDITIEGKNLKDINQSNFQSVGPYTGSIYIGLNRYFNAVYEPWQGRDIRENDGEDLDNRFKLGTYTENNRDFWELQTTDPITRKSQFENKTMKTAKARMSTTGNNIIPLSNQQLWSVDAFTFTNRDDVKTPLFFYYDKELHKQEYNLSTTGLVYMNIEIRTSGRSNTDNKMDNFLFRPVNRPFLAGLTTIKLDNSEGSVSGEGLYETDDTVQFIGFPNEKSYVHDIINENGQSQSLYFDGRAEETVTFNMPLQDFVTTYTFRPNPIIRMISKLDGVPNASIGIVGIYDSAETLNYLSDSTKTAEYIDSLSGDLGSGKQIYRPGTNLVPVHFNLDDKYSFQNLTYIGKNGEEELSMDTQELDSAPWNENDLGLTELSFFKLQRQPDYPNGDLTIFANYTILYFYIRSFNNWKITDDSSNLLWHIMRWGYGNVNILNNENDINFIQREIDSEITINSELDGFGGYERDEFFWYSDEDDISSAVLGAVNQFDDDILSESDSPQSITISKDLTVGVNESEVAQQITGTNNAYTYIFHKFKQLGTYVKISKTEDSHDFDISGAPHVSRVMRSQTNSSEVDANMYILGTQLDWEFTINVNHDLGEVGETPILHSINVWNDTGGDSSALIPKEPAFAVTDLQTSYEVNEIYSNFSYTPESLDDENYYKYIEFIFKSTIVPPPLEPFLGVFELTFQTNNDSYGTVSFLQESDEITQTTYIGSYGDDIETPTYAVNIDQWIPDFTSSPYNGEYSPLATDINITDDDAQLTSLSLTLGNAATAVINQILDSEFPNYDESERETIFEWFNDALVLDTNTQGQLTIAPYETNPGLYNLSGAKDLLNALDQNLELPRIPLKVNAIFTKIITITINPTTFVNNNNNVSYPIKWVSNWNQAAYEADSSIGNIENWTDDNQLDTTFSNMNEDSSTITIPYNWFNGNRELKIRQQIAPQSTADQGPENSFTGGADIGFSEEEISTFRYDTVITGTDRSFNLTLSYVGGF